MVATKKETKKTGDSAVKKRKQQEDSSSAVAARTTDEFNFPRGGASVLTPLEHKEISRKADEDVLFSNDGASAAAQSETPAAKKRKNNKGKASKKSDETPATSGKEKIKIESLSFKRLNVGMTMLGCISKINDLNLVVSLPHQLVGSVAITEISEPITKAVEAVAQAEEEDEEGVLPDLANLFKVGQWVRCCIIQLSGSDEQQGVSLDKRSKTKKRIDLSLKPEIVNNGVIVNDLAKGMSLGMSVQSVEDHGYILSTGIDGISGFCHNKDAKKYIEKFNSGNPLMEGQLVQCSVLNVPENKRTVNVTLEPKQVIDSTFDEPCSVIDSIVPGNLVSATVASIHTSGLVLTFMGFFEATVDLSHIGVRPEDIESKFKLGQNLKARITFCSLNTTPKKIGASLLPNIVELTQDNTPLEDRFPVGTIFEKVTVKRVDTKNGLDVDIDGLEKVKGFVHISRVADDHVTALSATAGDYKLDSVHRARVVGHRPVDNVLQLSMEQSVLDQKFLRVDDIQVGSIVEGTVQKLTDNGVVINLTGHITALAPRLHLADVKLTHPEKKFKPGSKVKGLVLVSDPVKKKVIVTLKRTIVNSDLPTIISYDDVKPGMITYGTISGFRPFGCIISYCNNVRALAPISELSDSFIKDPAENFQLGQSIKTRVLTVDASTASLRVSFKTTPPTEKEKTQKADKAASKKEKASSKPVINPVDSNITTAEDYAPGRVTKAKVTSVKENQVNLDLADNVKGRVHITEVFNSFDEIKNLKHPLRRIHHGTVIDVTVLGQHDSKSHTYLPITHRGKSNAMVECTLKSNPDAMDVDSATPKKPLEIKDLTKGDKFISFVSEVRNDSLMVNIGVNLRGRIAKVHVSQDVNVLNDLKSNYNVGQALHAVVLSVDGEKNRVDLANITDGDIATDPTVTDINSLEKGMVVRGTVTKADPSRGVVVKLADHLFGKIHLTDLCDDFVENPTKQFEPGNIVRCFILDLDKDTKKIDLSTRKSRLEEVESVSIGTPEVNKLADVKVDSVCKGYVQNVADKGLFVFVGRDTVGRVKISEVSDDFVKDWKAMFKSGQLVEAKVLSVDQDANQLELTLKKSAIDPSIGPKKTLADFSKGEKVKGVVTSVKPIGVFIKIENSVVSGLCHISQISDTAVSDVSKIYSVGDPVKAMILNVDLLKKRISFGLKASYFDEEDAEEDSDADSEVASEAGGDEGAEDEDDMMVDDEDDEANGMLNLADMDDSEQGSEDEEESDDEDEEMVELQESDNESDDEAVDALPIASGFNWTGETAPVLESEDEVEEESESEETQKKKKSKKSKDVTQDKTADLATQAPQVAADYERLLLGSPNSSYLWINYMAFQLQLSEVDKAREIGERALTKINFREEQEKLNVWVAMMNLENTFGTAESLEAVFKRAIVVCEPKKVYLQLVKIYERSNKFEKAEELWKATIKKFSQSSKVWTLFGMFYLQQNNVEGARELLQRSLQSLPKRKHIKTIVKFAQMEFKYGEAERGRTIFEGVMSNYPKRVDLWSIYLDMEIRNGEQDIIRRLFQRVTSMKHSSKKMKFFFKKWLAYEKDNGSEKDIDEVKKRALAYVESISS
ncbi:rRNA biogenesis protein rrp5 [Umbelopsis sp. WA50703]